MPRNSLGNLHKQRFWQRLFVREWREYRGLTQEQLADRVGMTPASLSRIERGLQPYNQGTLEALAKSLNCNRIDLMVRNPLDPESPWTLWDRIKPDQRKTAIKMLKALAEEEAA